MPVYNEGDFVLRALDALSQAAELADWRPAVTIVDDGSNDPPSLRALEEASARPGVRVLRQPNQGRFAARARGLRESDAEFILLLDARVEVEPNSLRQIRSGVDRGDHVWNFDVTPASGSWGALFWSGITKVWWRDYFRKREPIAFGVDDFDRYPKGTGAFFAPRSALESAVLAFESHFDDQALASDDTRLLRVIAAAHPINLSPDVMCRHHVKAGVQAWGRQAYYRGTTFVDGYLTDATRARSFLRTALAALLGGLGVAVVAPRTTGVAVACGCAAAAALTRSCGGSVRESAAVGTLAPVFGLLFGAGILRGLRLVARA